MQEYVQKAEAVAEEFLNKYDLNSAYDHDVVAEVLAALAEKDLLRFGFSDSDVTGPQKGDMAKAYAVISTLAGKSGVLANIYMVGGLLAPLCVAYQGTKAQKADILTKVAEGKMQLAFALTEPDAGSDAAAAKTQVLGGRAYFDFEPVSHYYREAPFSLFAGGTVEVQKMLIARSMGI